MESFRVFVEQTEFVDFILNEFNGVPSSQATNQHSNPFQTQNKPWSAKKPEIMNMWRNLRNDTPITMTPIMDNPTGGEHSSYGEDGIRITGSWFFISSVLGRIKDILNYENPQHKLRLIFRGIDKTRDSRPDRQSYVFYVNLEKRSMGKAGRPKKQPNLTPQLPT